MKLYLGIDCGATHLRVGLVDETGQLIGYEKVHSPLKSDPNQLFPTIDALAIKLLKQSDLSYELIEAVGLGIPGPLDLEHRQILHSSNLHNADPIDIPKSDILCDKEVYFDHDSNVALLGEVWSGAAQKMSEVVLLTIGSGVGGAILSKGQILYGADYQAGEIGHIYLADPTVSNLPECGLGHHGCLEAFMKAGDIKQACHFLSIGLASISNIFNPEAILLSGGMMAEIQPNLHQVIEEAKLYGIQPMIDQVKIESAALGDQAGVIGAAYLAMHNTQNRA